jgi:transcriptional regulator with XRE-family HTH domain
MPTRNSTQQGSSRHTLFDPERLVKRRTELGLLQKDVAAKAKISPQMLADMEKGRRVGSPRTRAAVARALQTSFRHLVYKDR